MVIGRASLISPIRGRDPSVCATHYHLRRDTPSTLRPRRLIPRPALGILNLADLFSNGRKQIFDSLPIREINHEGW